MRVIISCFFFLLISVAVLGANGQEEPFSEKKWERLTKKLDYSKVPQKVAPPTETTPPTQRQPQGSSSFEPSTVVPTGAATLFQGAGLIFTVVLVLLLLLLIIFMIANSRSNPALEAQNVALQNIDTIEEHIHEVDLDELFTQFVKTEEYHIALRMSFLMIIKQLSQMGLIKWEKQKTNWEYHSDLEDYSLKMEFGGMIQTFERFWYGEKVLSEHDFHRIENQFATFKTRLDEQA